MLLVRSYHRQIRAAAACGSAAQPSDERGQDRGGLRRLRALFRFGRHAGPSALGGADGISAAMLRVGLLHRRVDCDAEGSRHGARHDHHNYWLFLQSVRICSRRSIPPPPITKRVNIARSKLSPVYRNCFSTSSNQSGRFSTSRGLLPSGGPMMPSCCIMSRMRAARP